MNLTVGDIIKHRKFLDVALLIMDICETDRIFKIKVKWINQGYNKSFFINTPNQEIQIDIDDLYLWSKYINKNLKCVRHGKWEPISEYYE